MCTLPDVDQADNTNQEEKCYGRDYDESLNIRCPFDLHDIYEGQSN